MQRALDSFAPLNMGPPGETRSTTVIFRYGTVAPPEMPLRARMRGQAQRRPRPPLLWPPGAGTAADFPKSEQTLTCEAMEFARKNEIIGASKATTVPFIWIPVVPHKAVAEVSPNYRRGWLLWITDGRANPLIDRKVVGFVFVGVVAMVAVVTSPTTAGCSVV